MTGAHTQLNATHARMRPLFERLLEYLEDAGLAAWPGTDGLTLEEVLGDYVDAAAAGFVPNGDELRLRHPDLAALVQEFFAAPQRP
jgi:hypothetical protein